MSLFGFGKSNKSDPPAAGAGTGDFASGSEQDRYASHFSGVGEVAADKIKAGAKKAANYKGDGAEQDRYGAHFSGLGLDEQQVHRAAQSMKSGLGGYWGLGYDGQQRAKKLAGGTAMGAEQVRLKLAGRDEPSLYCDRTGSGRTSLASTEKM